MRDLYLEGLLSGCARPATFKEFVDLVWNLAGGYGPFRPAWEVYGLDPEKPHESYYYWYQSRESLEQRLERSLTSFPPANEAGLIEENARSKTLLLYTPVRAPVEELSLSLLRDTRGRFTWLEWERYDQLECSTIFVGGICFLSPTREELQRAIVPYLASLSDLFGHLLPHCRPQLAWCGEERAAEKLALRVAEKRDLWFINWVNVFGPSYVEKYGRDFLLNAPGFKKEELEGGSILYQVTEGFAPWEASDPPPEEVESYFDAHPLVHRVVYRPWLKRELANG
jgi:hypothetical protein